MALPATPVPLPFAAEGTGLNDAQWITDCRDALKDWPMYTNESGTGNGVSGAVSAGSTPWRVTRPPINDGSLSVTVAGGAQTVIETGTPTGTQVLVNYDTGELTFGTVPASSAAIAIGYQLCTWRDRTILTALMAGLREMFPRVGKLHSDQSNLVQVNTWEYQLPGWAMDPRSQILRLQVRDPDVPTQDWKDIWKYERVGLGTIRIPSAQRYSTAARMRVQGWGPYLELGDLEPQLYHLPIWFAAGTLLLKKASLQARSDSMPAVEQGAQRVTDMASLGQLYLQRFDSAMQEMQKAPGPGRRLRIVTSYDK